MNIYRPEFGAALRAFARVSERLVRLGLSAPVLVGGAAVELYSSSSVATGDLDISTPWQTEFEAALQAERFVRPSGPGQATRGWVHPDLGLGFEVVSDTLLDGKADCDRLRLIDFGDDGKIAVIAVGYDRGPHGPVRVRNRTRDARAGAAPVPASPGQRSRLP